MLKTTVKATAESRAASNDDSQPPGLDVRIVSSEILSVSAVD